MGTLGLSCLSLDVDATDSSSDVSSSVSWLGVNVPEEDDESSLEVL